MSLEIDPRVARRGLTCKFTTGAILLQRRKYCFTILLIDRIFLQPHLNHINAARSEYIYLLMAFDFLYYMEAPVPQYYVNHAILVQFLIRVDDWEL